MSMNEKRVFVTNEVSEVDMRARLELALRNPRWKDEELDERTYQELKKIALAAEINIVWSTRPGNPP